MSNKIMAKLFAIICLIFLCGSVVNAAPNMRVPDDVDISTLPGPGTGLYGQSDDKYIYRQERLRKSSSADEYSKPIVDDEEDGDEGKKDDSSKSKKNTDKNTDKKLSKNASDEDEDELVEEVELEVFGKSFFASATMPFSPQVDVPAPDDYMVSTGDIVEIVFWNDLSPASVYQVQVDSRGSLLIPSIGLIPASGNTIKELEQKVLSYVAKKTGKVDGFVRLVEVRNIRVTVSGEVMSPGQYSLSGLSTAFNAIYAGGGPGDIGSLRNISVIRGGEVISTIDFYAFLLKGIPEGDVPLKSGDVVHFPVSAAVCSIYGEVRRPAIYELKDGDRLSELLEIAGGISPTGYPMNVKITRFSGEVEPVVIDVNAMSIMSNKGSGENLVLRNGDRIDVYPTFMDPSNIVTISGPVKSPGSYEAREGMKVKDLIEAARGFDGEVYMIRGDVFRRNHDGTTTIVSFDVSKALDGDAENNIGIQPYDEVVFYQPEDAVFVDRTVTILGEVKEPGKYKRSDRMTVADIVNMAGGPLPQSASTVEVARVVDVKTGETEVNHLELSEVMSGKNAFAILDGDVIIVKKRQGSKLRPSVVSIMGEVNTPGHYALTSEHETISSIVKRSGGLTDKAFAKGAIFIRPEMSNINMEQSAIVEQIAKSFKNFADSIYKAQSASKGEGGVSSMAGGVSLGQGLAEAITKSVESSEALSALDQNNTMAEPQEYDTQGLIPERILIRFDEAMDHEGGYEDLVMRDGDVIIVPERPSTVIVSGAVVNPASFPFIPGQKLKSYLNRAGGYAMDSNPGMTVVVRANGEVYPFKSVKYIEEGDIVIVPWKPAKLDEKTDKWDRIQSIAQMASNIITSAYLVNKLGE